MSAIITPVARIDPGQMVAATRRESPGLLRLLRLAVGAVASFIVLTLTGNILGPWSFLPAIVIGSAAAYGANGRRLLQIGAEIAGQSDRSIPMSANPREPELVRAMNILPGDWICPADTYKEILEEAQQKYLRQRERAEMLRTASGQVEKASDDHSDQAGMKDPAIPLKYVIATEGSPDEKNMILKLENGDKPELSRYQPCYRRRPKYKPNPAPREVA
jgi:hypothetical protein